MTLTQIAVLLSVNLALIVGAMGILWLVALKVRDVSFIDGVWPLAMLFLAGVTWPRTEGDPARKWLLLGIVTLWALRLAWHLLRRWRASGGADARYVAILKGYGAKGWSFGKTALLIVFLPQAVLAWLTSLPVQLGQVAATPPLGVIALTGAVLALGGLVIETVGDAQLAAFRKDPATRGTVLDTGLWRYTPPPQLFRRRLRLVGPVADRGRERGRGPVVDRRTAAPDLHPDALVRHRHHREGDLEIATGLCRLCGAHQRLHPVAAEEDLMFVTENPRRDCDGG